LNLSETIHIFLRKGKNNLNHIQNLLILFIYLLGKTEIINILSRMPKTLTRIFKSIFVSFHIHDSKLEKNNFDFIIKQNNNINISNNYYSLRKDNLKAKLININNIKPFNTNNNNNNDSKQSNNDINIKSRIFIIKRI